MNAGKTPTQPPPSPSPAATAKELLTYADQMRAVAGQILARAGELTEVALEMKGAGR